MNPTSPSTTITTDRRALSARLQDARARTDEIFARLTPGALFERPIPERHRLVFYLGHVEAFDWNLVARRAFDVESFHPEFDALFAFGIDPVDGGLPNEPASAWPERAAIETYNARTRAIVDDCLMGRSTRDAEDLAVVFHMAIEHRLMHAETLAYLLHELPHASKRALGTPPAVTGRAADREPVRIPAGRATLGRRRDQGFGWDNEFDAHAVEVPAFAIDRTKVTNRDLLAFVNAGGYSNRTLWSESDWSWIAERGLAHPHFWRSRSGEWLYRGMFEATPLPLDAPAYVSHAEASAYARWKGQALPTEAQFHRAAYGTPSGGEREYPWGDVAPAAAHGNFDFHRWDPTPVGAFPAGDSAFGVSELVGNGWEWTSTPFAPFAGFRAHPHYEGYSANFFDGLHYVLKGGSPRTAACMLRRSFRNWFQPHYSYAYATFRLVG